MSDSLKIEVTEIEAPLLIAAYQSAASEARSTVKQCQDALNEALNKLTKIENTLQKLKLYANPVSKIDFVPEPEVTIKNLFIPEHSKNGVTYNAMASWWEKIHYVLSHCSGEKLTKNEILERIYNYEPLLKNNPKEKKRANSLSVLSRLSTKSKDGKLLKEMKGKELVYWLP